MTKTPPTPAAWSSRRPMIIGFFSIMILVIIFGVWGTTASLSGAVIASGQVEVEQSRQVVQHPDGGVAAEILVTEGQTVQAGDLLLRLDGVQLTSELTIVEGRLTELAARMARLEAERDGNSAPVYPADLLAQAKARPDVAAQVDGQTRLFDARADSVSRQVQQLTRRIEQTAAQIKGIDAQAAAIATQLDLIRQELLSQRTLLEKGLTQAASVLALQREEARLQGLVGELQSSRAQAEGRITEIEIEIGRLASSRREEATAELREVGPEVLELAERRRALTEQVLRLEIRAPVSGVVLGLAVTTPRAVIRPAEPVLYLVPQDRPLVIAAQVAPIDVDEINVGQRVELVFSGFSSRTTPHLIGTVTVVSADALSDQQTRVSYYRIEITLNEGEKERLEGQTLLPGMPVEAFVQTGAQTPIAYLIKPFTDYFSRAMRES